MIHEDCRPILEQALASPAGIALTFASRGEAVRFRARCHSLRKALRDDSRLMFEAGHPKWGKSEFDSLVLKIDKEAPVVRIVHYEPEKILEIIDLSSVMRR